MKPLLCSLQKQFKGYMLTDDRAADTYKVHHDKVIMWSRAL